MNNIYNWPAAYFLTFTSYATWLHGDKRGSTDHNNNTYLTPRIKTNTKYNILRKQQATHSNAHMNHTQREAVLRSIQQYCEKKAWHLYALHIRSNHVHAVVKAHETPEKMLTALKARASQSLNSLNNTKQKHWTRHGSTRYIWNENWLFPAVRYVILDQGNMLSYYVDKHFHDYLQEEINRREQST